MQVFKDYFIYELIIKIFFKTVQNKLHFATHSKIVQELIEDRSNAEKRKHVADYL
ncbi:virulence RhuM family protein [Clostridium cellulovorans]|uniref:virulence RhuM family protein n=1 Tax=Clostridium cellulovorans TaxID=1493 RepID=UPI0001E8ED32|nr:virulence RhuM family protein [Clostridium cellulovorans]